MFEYLYTWWFWVILLVFIMIAFYYYSKFTGNGIRTRTSQKTERDFSEFLKTKKTRKRLRKEDYPQVESINTDDSTEEFNRSIKEDIPDLRQVDFTPDLPEFVFDEEVKPKKQSKGEKRCKEVMEQIYGVPFQVQVRPKWLRNDLPKGRLMELDVSELSTLNIAVEYHGEHHYRYNKFYHKGDTENFHNQLYRDRLKAKLCQENGVYLIVVPYNCPLNKIESYIRYHLPEAVAARNGAKIFQN